MYTDEPVLVIQHASVCLFLKYLTGWNNTLQASKSQLLAGTSWLRLIWRGSLVSLEGYILYTEATVELSNSLNADIGFA